MINVLDNLKIVYFNPNSLLSKLSEVQLFLVKENIDIALFSETFLKSRHNICLPGYRLVRRDDADEKRGGGVAIAIREVIPFKEIRIPKVLPFPSVCGIRIIMANNDELCFLSVYVPNSITRICHRELQILLHLSPNMVLAGDFNARHESWNCVNNNSRGKSLFEFIQKSSSSHIKLHVPDRPTTVN